MLRRGRSDAARRSSSAFTTARRAARGREERGLGREVGLHRLVEVEMILCQVGEHGDVEADPVDPVLHQGVRGDLDARSRRSRRRAAGRGAVGGPATSGVVRAPPRVPTTAGAPAGPLEDRPQQVGRRRLAVRARHPDHVHRRPRGRRRRRRRPCAIAARDLPGATTSWTASREIGTERVLADERHRARRTRRCAAKSWPSWRAPGTQQKSAPGTTSTVVEDDVADSSIPVGSPSTASERAHDALEPDAVPPSFTGMGVTASRCRAAAPAVSAGA